jgi:hypothetical protein
MMRASTAMQRHDFDPISFIFGLLFAGSGILFLIGRFDLFNRARWLWPALLVLLGIAVLVGARGRGAHGSERAAAGGSAAGAGPIPEAPDLDAIEPPVGPEAFRLPGWPAPGTATRQAETPKAETPEAETPEAETPKAGTRGAGTREAAIGSSTDVLEPVQPSELDRPPEAGPDPHAETQVIPSGPDPHAETEVIATVDAEAETRILPEPRTPGPPASD